MYFEKFCKKCPEDSHCCIFNHDKGFTFVGVEDAKRIKQDTGREFGDFLDFSPLSKSVISILRHDDPALEGELRLSQLDSKNRILRLKKQMNGKCIFLTDKGKCGIYKSRPKVCRIYPFWAIRLLDDSLKVIEHDSTPSCPIVLSLRAKGDDVEKQLSKSQIEDIKNTFAEIETEDVLYKKEIDDFINCM